MTFKVRCLAQVVLNTEYRHILDPLDQEKESTSMLNLKNKNWLKAAVMIFITTGLAACGNANNGTTAATGLNQNNPFFPNGGIPGGQVGMCGGGMTYSQPITFQATNPVVNNVSILAGNLGPSTVHSGSYGQVSIGTGGFAVTANMMCKTSANGSIGIALNSAQGGNMLTGILNINPALIGGGFFPVQNQNPAGMIAGLGIDAVWTPNYNMQQQVYPGMPQINLQAPGWLNQVQVFVYSNYGAPLNLIF